MEIRLSRVLAGNSVNRKIFRAFLVIICITVLSKLAVAGKEIIVASRFGRGDAIESFLIAFVVPSFLINIISGSLSAAFIPTFVHVREAEGQEAARRLLATVTICSQVLLVIVTSVVVLLAPAYLPFVAHGFSASKLALAVRLTYVLSPYIFLQGLVVIWTAVLNAGERFALAAAVPAATPAIVVILLFARADWGVRAVAVGTVTGALVEAILVAGALRRKGINIVPSWGGFDAHVRKVFLQYLPMIAGSALMAGTVLVDQAMAAMLGTGSVAALSYGSRIVSLLTTLGATSLSTAVLPYFSQMVARKQWSEVRHTLWTFARLVFVITVPVALALSVFSEPLVRILYERGQFSAADTRVVASVQSMLVLQLPFYGMGIIGVRLISSMRKNQFLTFVSFSNLVFNIVLNWVFMRRWGISGIALSTSVVYLTACILVYAGIYDELRKQRQLAALAVAA